MNEEQERTAFEAWRRSVTTKMDPDDAVAREGFGDDAEYVNRTTRAMWIGWKGRALAALRPYQGGDHEN